MGRMLVGWGVSTVLGKAVGIVADAVGEEYKEFKLEKKLIGGLRVKVQLIAKVAYIATKSMQDNSELSNWINRVEEVIDEAEELTEELEYEKLKRAATRSSSSLQFDIKKWLKSDNFWLKRVEKLANDINTVAEHINGFNFLLNDYKDEVAERSVETTSLMNDDEKIKLCSRKEQDIILNILHDVGSSGEKLVVIPMHGIGGVGKTTLAKVIYNDQIVQAHFDLKAWVYVSTTHDTHKIMFNIINLFESQTPVGISDSLERLHQRLVDIISNKTFFLVFDNVPNKFINGQCWEHIKTALSQGRTSVLIVTTQYYEVASRMGTMVPIKLDILNETDYWSLFKYHAFGDKDVVFDDRVVLEDIGREISRKLNGLPLAAKVLGRMLHDKVDKYSWLEILNKEWWEHEDVVNKILPSLGLSYYYLETNLKLCLAYCSIFPRKYLFQRHQVVQMWIAHGCIQSCWNRRVEDVGKEWFDKLATMSFFQDAGNNMYIMNELALSFAKFVSRDKCFVMNDEKTAPPETIRHLAINTPITANVINRACRFKKLRTLVVFGNYKSYFTFDSLNEILKELKDLRVLDLSYSLSNGFSFPDCIGYLSHLRYLAMRGNGEISMPNSICKLFFLQVLDISDCEIGSLPNGIDHLTSLRHLYTDNKIIDKIKCIGKLSNLQELATFTAKKEKGYSIAELKEMNQLQGSLAIAGLGNVMSKEEALSAKMTEKKYLRRLALYSFNLEEKIDDKEILEGLQPHSYLQELEIKGYASSTTPSWIQQLRYLQSLCLSHCEKLQSLPPLGQLPFLMHLSLICLPSIANIRTEFYGNSTKAFPRLKELKIENLERLRCWEKCDAKDDNAVWFPSLQLLDISSCCMLERMPDLSLFFSLKTLHLSSCQCLESSSVNSIWNLTALENLSLCGCSQLTSLDGLKALVNLKSMTILACDLLAGPSPLSSMHGLLSITRLETDDSILRTDGSVSIGSAPSLRMLFIKNIYSDHFSIEQDKWFEELKSLQFLQFDGCPNLSTLPLCLPATLQELRIYSCSQLEESCKKGGADWINVAHIPAVQFDRNN